MPYPIHGLVLNKSLESGKVFFLVYDRLLLRIPLLVEETTTVRMLCLWNVCCKHHVMWNNFHHKTCLRRHLATETLHPPSSSVELKASVFIAISWFRRVAKNLEQKEGLACEEEGGHEVSHGGEAPGWCVEGCGGCVMPTGGSIK